MGRCAKRQLRGEQRFFPTLELQRLHATEWMGRSGSGRLCCGEGDQAPLGVADPMAPEEGDVPWLVLAATGGTAYARCWGWRRLQTSKASSWGRQQDRGGYGFTPCPLTASMLAGQGRAAAMLGTSSSPRPACFPSPKLCFCDGAAPASAKGWG